MWYFEGPRGRRYLVEEPVSRTELKARVINLKNGKRQLRRRFQGTC